MTDKPTDEIERRADRVNEIERLSHAQGKDAEKFEVHSRPFVWELIPLAREGLRHSAAKEEVEGLRALLHERETECVLKTDRISKLEAENAELKRTLEIERSRSKVRGDSLLSASEELSALKTAQGDLVEALEFYALNWHTKGSDYDTVLPNEIILEDKGNTARKLLERLRKGPADE